MPADNQEFTVNRVKKTHRHAAGVQFLRDFELYYTLSYIEVNYSAVRIIEVEFNRMLI